MLDYRNVKVEIEFYVSFLSGCTNCIGYGLLFTTVRGKSNLAGLAGNRDNLCRALFDVDAEEYK
jgi:hypothetical protein